MKGMDIANAVKGATAKWAKMRKAEYRGSRRPRGYVYSERVYFSDVAADILPDAYAHASGNRRYSVSKRQLHYACRDAFHKRTGRTLEYPYFANTLLVQYMNRHGPDWHITADPRGTLEVPNAGHKVSVPCGTIEIRRHLARARAGKSVDPFDFDPRVDVEWPSIAAGQRYQAVLYIEKEGFGPIMEEARIADRFDVAVVSNKGQSNVATRQFVDEVCKVNGGVPLFVVHDFDKAGFEIAQRLTQVSDWAIEYDRITYDFNNEINVTDLGLRLGDVEQYDLATEACDFKGGFAADSIATEEEREFLRGGERVELNAFTSPQFVEWIEAKLAEHLPKRLIPDDDVLTNAYRRAMAVAEVNLAIEQAKDAAVENAKAAEIPSNLRRKIAAEMEAAPDSGAWDRVLYDLAREHIEDGDEDEDESAEPGGEA